MDNSADPKDYTLDRAAPGMALVLEQVAEERGRQLRRWGVQNHPDRAREPFRGNFPREGAVLEALARDAMDTSKGGSRGDSWDAILAEEVGEVLQALDEGPERTREELVQVAAVAVAWIEAIDRRTP